MQTPAHPDADSPPFTREERLAAMDYVHDLKSFHQHLICFLSVNAGLTVLNLLFAPDHFWAKWVTAFWGLWLFVHAVATFEVVNIFARGWEHRAAQKRLRRL